MVKGKIKESIEESGAKLFRRPSNMRTETKDAKGEQRMRAVKRNTNPAIKEIARGAAHYWAPEVVRNQQCGTAVDMWALGCVLYLLLCGCNPFNPEGNINDVTLVTRIASARLDNVFENWDERHLTTHSKECIMALLEPVKTCVPFLLVS